MNVNAWRRQLCNFRIIRQYIHGFADKILESTSRCEQTQVKEGVQKTIVKTLALTVDPTLPPCGFTILKVENWETATGQQ